LLFCLLLPRPPRSPLFPYTTLFRSLSSLHFRLVQAAGKTPALHPAASIRHQQWICHLSLRTLRLCVGVYRCTPDSWSSPDTGKRSEEHTSELQSRENLVCRLLLEKK